MAVVGGGVQRCAQPGALLDDTRAHETRVFADPAGEHQCVDATGRGGQRTHLRARRDNSRDPTASRASGASLASSSRMSCEMPDTPRRPDCLYNRLVSAFTSMPFLLHQVEQYAEVEVAGAGSHHRGHPRR